MLIAVLLTQAVTADIFVFSPDTLKHDFESRYHSGVIKSSLAVFGNPPYGTVMLGRVFRPSEGQEKACDSLSLIDWTEDPDHPDPNNSPILLVDRGSCPFMVKVRNAQNIGARAVVIVNNRDEDVEAVTMTDSGVGSSLFIPTFLISQIDGDLIKGYLANPVYSRMVALNLHFSMPRAIDVVDYSIWISSGSKNSISFIQEFADYGKKFKKEVAVFTPRYVMWHCLQCSAYNYVSNEINCLSGGRYCAPDPDLNGPLTGRDVLKEDLREICVYKQALEAKHSYDVWFDYVKALNSTCTEGINEECSYAAMDKVGANAKNAKECVTRSFLGGNPALDDNTLLREQRLAWSESNLQFNPAVIINNQTYRGDLRAEPVFQAICSGYDPKSQPDICRSDETEPVKRDQDQIGVWTVVIIVLVCFGCAAVGLSIYSFWIRKKYKDEVKRQLSDAVHQYIALSETSRPNTSR